MGGARLLDQSEERGPRERLSMPGIGIGTPLYMAPEQLDDPNVDARVDVFALGAVLFEILTAQAAAHDGRGGGPGGRAGVGPRAGAAGGARAGAPVRARDLQEALARYLEGDRELEQRHELAAGTRAGRGGAAARERAAGGRRAGDRDRDPRAGAGAGARADDPGARGGVRRGHVDAAGPDVTRAARSTQGADAERDPRGTAYTGVTALAWFLFLSVIFAIGVRRVDYVLMIAVPIVLAPSSYVFEGGRLITRPQMIALPRIGTFAFVSLTNAGLGLTPAIFVARLRPELTGAQQRELLRAWPLRRLPEALMRASPR